MISKIKTLFQKRIKYSMSREIPHYGDILKKVENVVKSCTTTDQVGSAWRYADLFEEQCKRMGVNDQTRMVMRSTVNNLLEDQWETVRLEKLKQYENGC